MDAKTAPQGVTIAREFTPQVDELTAIRGRVDFSASMRLVMTRLPRLVCDFDELSANILINQVLRSTMLRLSRTAGLDPGQRDELKRLDREFRDVDVVRLDAMIFRRATVHMNNAYYGFLLKVCELAFEATLPDADGSGFRFTEVLRDERKMALVFQAFVRNFYRIEQSRFSVVPLQLRWDATAQNASDHDLLPVMTTDIFLRSPDRKIIIDTKYYASALTEHHGKKSFHSDHLFQLFAYLKNARTRGAEYLTPEGVLLYPAVGERLNSRFAIQGHPVTVATVNLDQPWKDIRIGLLDLLENGPVARVREQETEP